MRILRKNIMYVVFMRDEMNFIGYYHRTIVADDVIFRVFRNDLYPTATTVYKTVEEQNIISVIG